MIYLIGIQLIYTAVCVYMLVKKLDWETPLSKSVLYGFSSFIVLMLALVLPLIVNIDDPLARGFVMYIGLYFSFFALFLPDEIMKDKHHTTLIKLSNFVFYYYLVVYLPIIMFNISNTLSIFGVIMKTIVLTIVFILLIIGVRHIDKVVKKNKDIYTLSFVTLGVVLVLFISTYQYVGRVNLTEYESRKTNFVHFDDDYYLANDYTFEIENIGEYVFDYTEDQEYVYLVTSDGLGQQVYVSLFDRVSLQRVETYTFEPHNQEYIWYLHRHEDYIFNQKGVVYFRFIDGIYTFSNGEKNQIATISDIQSYKFLYNNEFHIAAKEGDHYNIYQLNGTELVVVDTISDSEDSLEFKSVNNELIYKDYSNKQIIVYPNDVYTVPVEMMGYPVFSYYDDMLFLGHDLNDLLLEGGLTAGNFNYFLVDKTDRITHVESDDYMFELSSYSFKDENILYETFPEIMVYDFSLKDVHLPNAFIDVDKFGKEYEYIGRLKKSQNELHTIFYKTISFNENRTYIEISEVKQVEKTFDFGYITNFAQESFLFIIIISLLYSRNNTLKKYYEDKYKAIT